MAEDDVRERYRQSVDRTEADISRQRAAIGERETREARINTQNGGYGYTYQDPALPLMRRRLTQSEALLASLINKLVLPKGLGEPDLKAEKASPGQKALRAVFEALARKRALPAEDPVVDEDAVEAEYERNLGPRKQQKGVTPR